MYFLFLNVEITSSTSLQQVRTWLKDARTTNPGKSRETVFDLVEMEDAERREGGLADVRFRVAGYLARFRNIDMAYEVLDSENLRAAEFEII